jgi:carboxyl-terminal processing protease
MLTDMKRYISLIIVLIALFSLQAVHVNKDKLYEIARNIEIFTNIYKELNTNYVDEIDPSRLMRTGIDAMVQSLDPYTNYISESQIESFRISTEGKYSGIGAVIREVDSVLTVIEAYENSPAIAAGLIPGDQILRVNGEETRGRNSDDVRNIMRGAPGSTIDLEILRFGETVPRQVTVNREEVNIPNVPHYEVLDSQFAYVHLSRFTQNAGANVRAAIREMQKEHDISGVILDLRDNGGGLLREAIAVTNLFIDKDEEIVSTRGKVYERDRVYTTTAPAMDTSVALVVLINNRSASASEIVSGAVQDLDRGVLIGQKTYGKGLVQNTLDVGYNSQVKLTTSKYYIPSGRCIQSVAYKNGEPVDIPDDERQPFKTRNGRTVLDGGGVQPDIRLPAEKMPEFVTFLLRENIVFKYVNGFFAANDSIPVAGLFHFDAYPDFVAYYQSLGPDYQSRVEKEFEEFRKAFAEEYEDPSLILSIEQSIPGDLELLEKYRDQIIREIEREIISRYYYINGKVQYSLRNDPELEEALGLFANMDKYNSIIRGQQ